MKVTKPPGWKFARAKWMREHPTPGEHRMWQLLKSQQLGCTFLRQRVLYGFIPDFVCVERRLIVEVDGSSHEGREDYDRWRDGIFAQYGYRTVRFTNNDTMRRKKWIVTTLMSILEGDE